jgi:hypothetical protein
MNGLARRVTDDSSSSSSSSWRRLRCTPVITSRTQTDDFHACVWRWRFSSDCDDYDEIILGTRRDGRRSVKPQERNSRAVCYYDTGILHVCLYTCILYPVVCRSVVYTQTIDGNKSLVLYRQPDNDDIVIIFTHNASLFLVIYACIIIYNIINVTTIGSSE